jgi:hypothetical protein
VHKGSPLPHFGKTLVFSQKNKKNKVSDRMVGSRAFSLKLCFFCFFWKTQGFFQNAAGGCLCALWFFWKTQGFFQNAAGGCAEVTDCQTWASQLKHFTSRESPAAVLKWCVRLSHRERNQREAKKVDLGGGP